MLPFKKKARRTINIYAKLSNLSLILISLFILSIKKTIKLNYNLFVVTSDIYTEIYLLSIVKSLVPT